MGTGYILRILLLYVFVEDRAYETREVSFASSLGRFQERSNYSGSVRHPQSKFSEDMAANSRNMLGEEINRMVLP